MDSSANPLSVVMIGATGAVGSEVVNALLRTSSLERLALLGRRPLDDVPNERATQHQIDIFDPGSYRDVLPGHRTAICTLGVGQPSKMSRQAFIRIDKQAVLDFATECKRAGIRHFQLLSSVGAHSNSASFYLRTKGELQDALAALRFDRLTLCQPSMILTEHNRYGLIQGLTLAVWPWLGVALVGPLRKYRGIPVAVLGSAIAANVATTGGHVETLQWDDFVALGT